MNERMRDSAFASTINPSWAGAVGGYYGGPDAYNVWAHADWKRFRDNRKLPIWVGGQDGPGEARRAIEALRGLGVPKRVYTVLDMGGRVQGLGLRAGVLGVRQPPPQRVLGGRLCRPGPVHAQPQARAGHAVRQG